jgi:ADP-heptose:LPS heptosyltransferase
MASPLFEAVKRRFPRARLTVMASPRASEALDSSPWVDDVILHDASWNESEFSISHKLRDCWETARYFKDKGFDLVLSGSDRSLFDSLLLSFIPARFKAGYNIGGGGFALTHPVPSKRGVHRVEKNLALARVLGVPTVDLRPFLRIRMEDDKIAAAYFEDKGLEPERDLIVALHPGASQNSRQWGTERFAQTAGLLVRAGAKVLLFGGLAEREAALAIKREVPEVMNLAGKTGIRQMAGLMARCRVFVGNDAGPAHVAAAMGVPSALAFSGANDPREQAPYGVRSVTLTHPVPCSPCRLAVCPLQGEESMKCLRPVSPSELAEAALKLARQA